MKKYLTGICCLIFFFLYNCTTDKKISEKSIRIATLNCEFLWDGIEPEDGNTAVRFPHKGNPVLAREHMHKIAEIIKTINADIINLVEVEGIEALKYLNDSFLFNLNYQIGFVNGIDTYTGQDVAILSKYPVNKIFRHTDKGRSGDVEKSVSKNYVADITIGNLEITLIGIHLLSKPTDISRIKEREAQADAIHQIEIIKANEGNQIVVFGDFNDYDGDTSCLDINNNIPVTGVLEIIRECDVSDKSDDLLNITTLISKDQRYTSHWDRDNQKDVDKDELSSIDHILLSPALFKKVVSAEIYHNYNPLEVSDHYPVIIDLLISAE